MDNSLLCIKAYPTKIKISLSLMHPIPIDKASLKRLLVLSQISFLNTWTAAVMLCGGCTENIPILLNWQGKRLGWWWMHGVNIWWSYSRCLQGNWAPVAQRNLASTVVSPWLKFKISACVRVCVCVCVCARVYVCACVCVCVGGAGGGGGEEYWTTWKQHQE